MPKKLPKVMLSSRNGRGLLFNAELFVYAVNNRRCEDVAAYDERSNGQDRRRNDTTGNRNAYSNNCSK